jgi:hypothetical protein
MAHFTAAQLKLAHSIQQTIESLQSRIDSLNNKRAKALGVGGTAISGRRGGRNNISAAGRARIAAAQKLRWSKIKRKSGNAPNKTGRTMSPAARAKIARAARARWAKAKAAGKNRL